MDIPAALKVEVLDAEEVAVGPLGCTVGCTLHIVTEAIPSQNQKAAVSVTVV